MTGRRKQRTGARQLLEASLERLRKRGTFAQTDFCYAVNRDNIAVKIEAPDAVRFCAAGHLARSAYELLGLTEEAENLWGNRSVLKALRLLDHAAGEVVRPGEVDFERSVFKPIAAVGEELPPRRARNVVVKAYERALEIA